MTFSTDYFAARTRFLVAARARDAVVATHVHPGVRGPADRDLAIDVAWLGPADARTVLLVTSGMHGFEGPAGSAVQSAWAESGGAIPPGVAVCLVHALNPWGFAWVSRLTENNVDLNRNFVDWDRPPPANPYYARVREAIRVPDLEPQTLMRLLAFQQDMVAELGPAAAQIAVDFGQYEDPEGITYGGAGPEFAHRVVRDELVPMLAHARTLGVIDWHTGVGAYNEVAVLPIDGPGSANAKALARWWGAERVEHWKRSPLEAQIASDPNAANLPGIKTGQMKQALRRWLPETQVMGAVVEFGTEKEGALPDLVFVTLYERWLRFVHRGDRLAPEHERFRALARNCFVPDDPAWRRTVVTEGPKLIDQALAALA